LLRIIAHCLRFRITNKRIGPLSAKEINKIEIGVLKILQTIRFAEIKRLESKTPIGKSRLVNPIFRRRQVDSRWSAALDVQANICTRTSYFTISSTLFNRPYYSQNMRNIITQVYKLHFTLFVKNSGYRMAKIKCERLYAHAGAMFVFTPGQSNPKWEIFHRFAYARPNLLRAPMLISAILYKREKIL